MHIRAYTEHALPQTTKCSIVESRIEGTRRSKGHFRNSENLPPSIDKHSFDTSTRSATIQSLSAIRLCDRSFGTRWHLCAYLKTGLLFDGRIIMAQRNNIADNERNILQKFRRYLCLSARVERADNVAFRRGRGSAWNQSTSTTLVAGFRVYVCRLDQHCVPLIWCSRILTVLFFRLLRRRQ